MTVPNIKKLPTKPRSKEYDAVYRTWKAMTDEDIQALSWREFQQKFQQVAKQFPQLFTEIRHNRPAVQQDDLKKWLDRQESRDEYGITYDKYHKPEHSYRDVEQLVMQLNQGADASRIVKADPGLSQFLSLVGRSSGASGHPARIDTVGWLRVDFVNKDWLFVDEIQSDLVNAIAQAQAYLASPDFRTWYSAQNEGVRAKVDEIEDAESRFTSAKHQLQTAYSVEDLEAMKGRIIELFEDWTEYALATILEIARSHGIRNVAINSSESIATRDTSVDPAKVKMYYDNLAKSFGFKKQQIDMGSEGLSGTFWTRKASLQTYLTC